MAQRVFVISDLHMASQGRGFFSAQQALEDFIEFITKVPGEVDLMILGDALDYLQIEPYLSFTAAQAERKTAAIIANNDGVFDALHDFAAADGKRLRWAIGNHDLELLFPVARQLLEQKILGGDAGQHSPKLIWHRDGKHFDYVTANGFTIRLIHGNAGDRWNAINYDAAEAAALSGDATESIYPPGSVLVAKVLNPLHSQGFRHVHMLKPETTVALPLSLALWPDDTWDLVRAAFPLFAKKKYSDMTAWLAERLGLVAKTTFASSRGGEPEEPAEPAEPASIEQLFGALFEQTIAASDTPVDQALADDLGGWLTNDNVRELLDHYLEDAGTARSPKFQAQGWIKRSIGALLQGAARIANGAGNPWIIDQEDELAGPVQRAFADDRVVAVIAGHTHLARTVSYRGGYYINTGTWADLMKIPRCIPGEDFKDYARNLRGYLEAPESCPFELRPFQRPTYVEIELNDAGSSTPYRISLREWPTESSKLLHQYP